VSLYLAPGSSLAVEAGRVWLTQDGSPDDLVLGAGDRFAVTRKGQQVVSAVDSYARIRVMDVHAHARALRRAELRRLAQRFRRVIALAP